MENKDPQRKGRTGGAITIIMRKARGSRVPEEEGVRRPRRMTPGEQGPNMRKVRENKDLKIRKAMEGKNPQMKQSRETKDPSPPAVKGKGEQ